LLEKRKQILVDGVGLGRRHAVRKALVDVERAVLEELNA
jgi:hypothetical protein